MSDGPLLERIRTEGDAVVIHEPPPGEVDAEALVAAIRRAVDVRDDALAALGAWDEAGRLHDPETLDEALRVTAPRVGVPFVSGLRRRRLRAAARDALERTRAAGTVRLLLAVLGSVGGREDVPAMETAARHPAFVLHGTTALANVGHWEARAALLRLLSQTRGTDRVVVIDRLLPFVREPAVRLALVRDAFDGLPDADAREIAPAVVETLGLRDWLDEERVPEGLREKVRHILSFIDD